MKKEHINSFSPPFNVILKNPKFFILEKKIFAREKSKFKTLIFLLEDFPVYFLNLTHYGRFLGVFDFHPQRETKFS